MKKILVVLMLLVFAIPAHAQEDAPCDVAALTATYAETLTAVTDLAGLEAVSAQMRMDIATCQGLSYVSQGSDVMGPLDLEQGVYLVEFGYNDQIPSTTFMFFEVSPIGHDETVLLFGNLSPDKPTAKTTMEVDGGTYLIGVNAMPEQWYVTLTKAD